MKKYAVIFAILILLLNTTVVFAGERGNVGFNYLNYNYRFNDSLEGDLAFKEVTGGVNLGAGFSLQGGYSTGEYDSYIDADLQDINLGVMRDFIPGESMDLALGVGVDYSKFSTSVFSQDLFDVERKSINLIMDFERNLTDRLTLFTTAGYGLKGSYDVNSPILEEGVNLEEITGYEVDNNYKVQAGVNFNLSQDLSFKLGYRIEKEEVKNNEFSNLGITVDGKQLADLTAINRVNQGLFFGAETRF